MNTLFEVHEVLNTLRANGDNDSFGVCYKSQSNRFNCHYVIVRSEEELKNLKEFYREYDFVFNKLGV
jgi:hypothetical protein